jgi:hypothetical protein
VPQKGFGGDNFVDPKNKIVPFIFFNFSNNVRKKYKSPLGTLKHNLNSVLGTKNLVSKINIKTQTGIRRFLFYFLNIAEKLAISFH